MVAGPFATIRRQENRRRCRQVVKAKEEIANSRETEQEIGRFSGARHAAGPRRASVLEPIERARRRSLGLRPQFRPTERVRGEN